VIGRFEDGNRAEALSKAQGLLSISVPSPTRDRGPEGQRWGETTIGVWASGPGDVRSRPQLSCSTPPPPPIAPSPPAFETHPFHETDEMGCRGIKSYATIAVGALCHSLEVYAWLRRRRLVPIAGGHRTPRPTLARPTSLIGRSPGLRVFTQFLQRQGIRHGPIPIHVGTAYVAGGTGSRPPKPLAPDAALRAHSFRGPNLGSQDH